MASDLLIKKIKRTYQKILEIQDEIDTSFVQESIRRAEAEMRHEIEQLGNLINQL